MIVLFWRRAWQQLDYALMFSAGQTADSLPAKEEGGKTGSLPAAGGYLPGEGFQEYLSRALKASDKLATERLEEPEEESRVLPWDAIQEALAAGESIESVARRFGRGKGEIELIYHLRRARD
ncbi:MAG: hypothetical protein ACPL5F_02215 [Moorellaceae bacterium]